VLTYTIRATSTVGSFGYTLQARTGADQGTLQSALFTLTVTTADTSASATKSNLFINQVLPTGSTYIRTDSALIVSAGQNADLTLMTPSKVGYAMGEFRNAAGDSINATTGTNVSGTMVVKITSGPGWLSRYDTATSTQLVREISITRGDSIVIWNDGSSGVGTITGYIGGTPLTDAADTITFYGKATSLVATANAVTASGWNLTAGADSATSGTAIVTFLAKDAASIAVPSASQNRNSALFLISSDTKVVRSTTSATNGYASCTAPSTATNIAAGKWSCDVFVIDSGTVTLTIADSYTIASSTYTSNAITVTIAGDAFTGTLEFASLAGVAKTAFAPSESSLMTITCKDRAGRTCGQPSTTAVTYSGLFTYPTVSQNKQFWIGATTSTVGGVSTGTATLATVQSWLASGATFNGGTETAVVNMPVTTGDVTINVYTSYDSSTSNVAISKTLTVTDATQVATKDASDAATDAALEATDAAYAAQDAAQLAAEAADAATAAAEAATAAVEDLATQVASLFADLQKQITTLANVVAKIAKKVKA